MANPNLLVIGKNSFLAQSFLKRHAGGNLESASHDDPDLKQKIEKADTVINFAFHPALFTDEYDPALDLDVKLAEVIKNTIKKYVLLSSRTVYGAYNGIPFHENMPLNPHTPYGRNKKIIEEKCTDVLGGNLLILRPSTITGFEYGENARRTFMFRLLKTLKEKDHIEFDISPDSRRDFLPAPAFAEILSHLVQIDAKGVYNIAAGHEKADIFINADKLKSTGINPPAIKDIIDHAQKLGQILAET